MKLMMKILRRLHQQLHLHIPNFQRHLLLRPLQLLLNTPILHRVYFRSIFFPVVGIFQGFQNVFWFCFKQQLHRQRHLCQLQPHQLLPQAPHLDLQRHHQLAQRLQWLSLLRLHQLHRHQLLHVQLAGPLEMMEIVNPTKIRSMLHALQVVSLFKSINVSGKL